MTKWSTYEIFYPSLALINDFDLTYGVIHLSRQHNIKITYSHVPGHQDSTTPFKLDTNSLNDASK